MDARTLEEMEYYPVDIPQQLN